MIGTGKLKKGTYSIFTIPDKGEWTVIFSKSLELWGADGYKDADDAFRTSIKTSALTEKVETFSIDFKNITNNSVDLCIEWEKTRVTIPISVPTEQKVMASIKSTMDGPSANSYVAAARYYLDSDKDPKQALEWINKGLEKGGERYWILRAKSLIQAKLGDKKGAIETAKRSLELATKEKNADYVKMNEDSIKEWSK
jgi:tetratricopeptide (TPR) repeat protein